jgi:hypothetical protein
VSSDQSSLPGPDAPRWTRREIVDLIHEGLPIIEAMVDETVRDRVARTLYEASPPRYGYSWPWKKLTPAGRDEWVCQADALLAAFPGIGLFERLEAWMSDDPLRRDVWITKRRGEPFDVLIVASGSGLGPGTDRGEGGAASPAAALSAALDQAETQERER